MQGKSIFALGVLTLAVTAGTVFGWISSAWNVLLMILGFSLVIFVHELGHFLMAKLCGVRVDKLAIGFGKELFGRTYGETRYAFNILPLGGYVKMLGQEDFEIDKSGEWKVKDNPRSFTNKSVGRRMLIVSSGVVMNLLFAALAFMVVFMVGFMARPPKVGHVVPGSPANRAGLMVGDRILTINDDVMDDYSDVQRGVMLSDTDRPIKVTVRREGQPDPVDIFIDPEWSEENKIRQIGIHYPMTLRVGLMELVEEADRDAKDRIQVGDTIVEVDGVTVANHVDVERLITEKRGQPVEVVVDRPDDPTKPDRPSRRMTCRHRAQMVIIPTGQGLEGQHLLGLQPRPVTLQVEPKGPAGRAGMRNGDVIVKWGDQWNPSAAECKRMLLAKDEDGRYVHAGRDIEVIVRRAGMSKEIGIGPDRPTGVVIGASILAPLLEQRDDLALQAYKDRPAAAKRILEILGQAATDRNLLDEARADLERRGSSAQGLARWLVDLDRRTFVFRPKGKGYWGSGPPLAQIMFGAMESDRLIVGKVVEKDFDGSPTPAAALNLPRGALITHVNGKRLKTWMELVEAFRTNAGKVVTVTHAHAGVQANGEMTVPESLATALNLPPIAKVLAIAGEKRTTFERDGKPVPVSLPYWGAAYEILKAHQGQTVPVTYRHAGKEISTRPDGKPLTYTVSADNVNPWLMRVIYTTSLIYYPERVMLQKRNPLAAMWLGFKKTGNFILQAYKTMRHVIFTQKVGVEHISGPVGILRYGHDAAESGPIVLLYFLAFISANLAVINFLPLPIVDGGLFVFLLLEKIRGRPVSIKMQVITQVIGLVLIVGIFVFVTFLDVTKWVGDG